MIAVDVQVGQYVQGRHVAGRVCEVLRGVGIGTVTWWLEDGRCVVTPAASRVEAWW